MPEQRAHSDACSARRSTHPPARPPAHLANGLALDLLLIELVEGALVNRPVPCRRGEHRDESRGSKPGASGWAGSRGVRCSTPAGGGGTARTACQPSRPFPSLTWVVQPVFLRQYPLDKLLVGFAHVVHVPQHHSIIVRECVITLKSALTHHGSRTGGAGNFQCGSAMR